MWAARWLRVSGQTADGLGQVEVYDQRCIVGICLEEDQEASYDPADHYGSVDAAQFISGGFTAGGARKPRTDLRGLCGAVKEDKGEIP